MVGSNFLTLQTLLIVGLGVVAFMLSTAGGMVGGVVMYKLTKGKVNPFIGSAGVSAVPMAARVSNMVGQKYNPSNFLLMHAMGPNVAGVIGSAIAAGFLLSVFGGYANRLQSRLLCIFPPQRGRKYALAGFLLSVFGG
jgi:oxaloacetate decarboxylase beta subunit